MIINTSKRKGSWIVGIVLLTMMGLAESSAQAAAYPDAVTIGPSPAPAFPSAFAAFDPPVTNLSVDSRAPAIAEWTRSNNPGDTLALTGNDLSSHSNDAEGRDTCFTLFGQSGTTKVRADALVQSLNGMQAAITIPNDQNLPTDTMYLLWPRNERGFGEPVAINRAESWWVGLDKVSPNEVFSVFGRNLVLGSGVCHLYIEELDRWLTSDSANPYKADFEVPADIPAGNYTIWVHNGHGREYGWSAPRSLTVKNPLVWSGATINVKDFGAKGDGVADDRQAIVDALAACSSYGTVYFPAGTYLISSKIIWIPANSRILGAGPEASTISAHPSYAGEGRDHGMIHAGISNTEFKDIGFESGPHNDGKILRCRGSRDFRIVNCRFSQQGNTTVASLVDVISAKDLYMEDSDFLVGTEMLLGTSLGAIINDCNFYGINDAGHLVNINGADNISFSGCTGQPFDNSDWTDGSGWCEGRFIHGSGNGGPNVNTYIGGCTTTDMYTRYNFSIGRWDSEQYWNFNTGEQIMFEHQRTLYKGSVVSASPSTVRCSGLTSDQSNHMIVITGGKGFGQTRYISPDSTSSGLVTITEPWQVVPDSSSTVMIGRYVYRTVVYDNDLDGGSQCYVDGNYEFEPGTFVVTASAGVSFYGGHGDCVVENNRMAELQSGMLNWSTPENSAGNGLITIQPSYFNLFRNNSVSNCRYGMGDNIYVPEGNHDAGVGVLGAVWRNNSFNNMTGKLLMSYTDRTDITVENSIFDHNVATGFDVLSEDRYGLYNQTWIGNTLSGSGDGLVFNSGNSHTLSKNTYSGFDDNYVGALPGAQLLVPHRVVNLVENGDVPILNSGTDTLSWSATSDSAWLNITKSSGVVSDETTSDALLLEVVGTPAAGDEAIVTVSAGGQTEQLTVVYDAIATLPGPPDPPPAPVLTGIEISGSASVNEGATAQYVCTASYSDGTTATVSASWSENSSSTSISSSGLLSVGNLSADKVRIITASFEGEIDTFDVTLIDVPAVLTGITISGLSSVNEETTAQYTCTANYSDGTSTTVTPSWSENSSSTTINSSGLLSAGSVSADKTVTITASFSGQSDTHTVTVKYVPPVLTGITISGPSSLNEETTAQYTCTASYSDGTSAVVAPSWSENASSASISSSGVLSAGNVSANTGLTITASFGGRSDTHGVTIQYVAPVLTGLTISGPSSIDEETSAQYICIASYSDGTSTAVTPSWSENSSSTTISSSGVLSAGDISANRSVTITASFGGRSDTHAVTVKYVAPLVTLDSITIAGPGSVLENSTEQYVCTGHYSDGSSATVAPGWSENSSATTISGTGVLSTGNISSDKSVIVTASFDGQTATKVLAVMAVGNQVVFPLSGFSGKTVLAELWNETAEEWTTLGEEFEPSELVVENVTPDQWYWVGLSEYDDNAGEWVLVHGRWIMR